MLQEIDNTSRATIIKSFDKISRQVMLESVLKVNEIEFRIVEIEFYHYDEKLHPDPFVHCDAVQLEADKFYFHGSGLDITLGNKVNYSSLLIRGIHNIKTGEYKSGPLNVVHEIFKAFKNVSDPGNVIRLMNYVALPGINGPYSFARVGLTKRKEDAGQNEFFDMPYRYLSDVIEEHKFKDKEAFVSSMLTQGIIGENEVEKMLGYKIKLRS